MANPQLEDGYVRVATEVWEALCRIRIPGEARQVLDVIIRKTWGWNKKEDRISLSQFVEATGLKKDKIIRARGKLVSMNIVSFKGNGNGATYRINKNYHSWQPLPKKETYPKKEISVSQKGNPSFPLKEPTIDTTTTDTITIDKNNMCEQAKEVIVYLNERTISRYRPMGKNLDLVKARLREGFTIEDCKQVIEGQKMDPYFLANPKYFRPSTLFGNKFEGYLSAASKMQAAWSVDPEELRAKKIRAAAGDAWEAKKKREELQDGKQNCLPEKVG